MIFLKLKKNANIQCFVRSFVIPKSRDLSDNWGGGCLIIYSCYVRRISFEINSNSKEIRLSAKLDAIFI